jgi:hypothetical protein
MRRPKRLRRKASEMSGPKAMGEIGRYQDDWYIVTKVGSSGGTSGPCFYGPLAKTSITYSKLRAACQLVKPEDLPSEVAAALAYYTLTGKKVVHV